jgi:sulfur relay (sulfurtransferase) DsrF/TusC family protein
MASAIPWDRETIPELWIFKLREAQLRHSAAVETQRQLSRAYKAGLFLSADRVFALQQAQREENLALQEYMRVLKIFTDFLLKGELPPQV